MRLTRLIVENFLPYEHASITLPPVGLVLLAGANNSGKTSFLRAFDVLAAEEPQAGLRSRRSNAAASVQAHFELNADDRDDLVRSFGASTTLVAQFQEQDAWRKLWSTWTELPDGRLALTGVDAEHRNGTHTLARVRVGDPGYEMFWVSLSDLDADADLPSELPLPMAISGSVPPEALLRLTQAGHLPELLNGWRSDLYHLDAARSAGTRARPLSAAARLASDGTNLAEVLDTLHTHPRYGGRWEAITVALRRVLPTVGSLQTRTETGELAVGVLDEALDELIPLWDLGSGVAQVLFALVAALHRDRGGLILIEEPEIHLHPAAQRELLDVLLELSEDRLFVITTHSPVLLDQFDHPRVQVHVVERTAGLSTIITPSDPSAAAMRSLGVRPSDILDASAIVIVEGPSDQATLRHWFGPTLSRRGVRVIEGQGGDGAWHTANLERLLTEAHAIPRQVLFIRDRDELSDDDVRRLETTGCVLVLDRRELENFFLDQPDAVASVLTERTGKQISSDGTAQAMRQAADTFRDAVVCKRVANTVLGPLRIFDRRRLRDIVVEGASAEALVAMATAAVPADLGEVMAREWRAEHDRLSTVWDADWQKIAPGEEVLSAVWREHGISYQKTRDSVLIAERATAPAELGQRIAAFVEPGPGESD